MTVQELITELAKMPQDYEIDPSGENGVDLGSRVNMDPKTQFKLRLCDLSPETSCVVPRKGDLR
jgi:hypothetical protein